MAPLLKFLRDETGAVAVYIALTAPIIVGMIALGGEFGSWYLIRQQLQHAADLGAMSGAIPAASGATASETTATVEEFALTSGLRATDTIEVNVPPSSGPHAGDSDYVEVVVDRTIPRYFSAIFAEGSVTISVRTVGGLKLKDSPTCIAALERQGSGAVTITGVRQATLDGCSVATNSSSTTAFEMSGNGDLLADCIYTFGGATITTGVSLSVCAQPRPLHIRFPDPYADTSVPLLTATPEPSNKLKDQSFTPTQVNELGEPVALFSNGLTIDGWVSLDPGLYIVDGGRLSIRRNSRLWGSGITFFLANGAELDVHKLADLGNSTDGALSAPVSGPYAGLLFYADPGSSGVTHVYEGRGGSNFNGVIYMPADALTFKGATGSGCQRILVKSIDLSLTSDLDLGCLPTGAEEIHSDYVMAVFE